MQAHRQRSGIMRHGARLLALTVLAVLCCMAAVPVLGAAEQVGTIDKVKGNAFVTRDGQRASASVRTPVFLGDTLETAPASTLEVLFADESRVKVAPGTVLEITQYIYDPGGGQRDSLLSLWSGKARFVANNLEGFRDSRFRVQTHTGTIGTRDTDFIILTREKKSTRVLALIHPIVFCNCNRVTEEKIKCWDVDPFYTSEQVGTEAASPPRLVTPEELEVWLADVTTHGEATKFRNIYHRDRAWIGH